MNTKESLERFGTISFSYEWMDETIQITDDRMDIAKWLMLVPDKYKIQTFDIVKDSLLVFGKEPLTPSIKPAFLKDIISRVEKNMTKH